MMTSKYDWLTSGVGATALAVFLGVCAVYAFIKFGASLEGFVIGGLSAFACCGAMVWAWNDFMHLVDRQPVERELRL